MSKASVFIVEDEGIVADDIRETLINLGYTVAGTERFGEIAIEKVKKLEPNLVLMDIHLAGTLDGIDAAEKIRTLYHIPVIFLTAHADETSLERAKVTEPYGYVLKPFNERELHSSIEMALYKHQMEVLAHENERTIQILVNAIPDAVMLLDHNRQIIALNDSMACRFGYNCIQTDGDSVIHLNRKEIFGSLESQLSRLLHSGPPVHIEEKVGNKWFEVSFLLIPASEGQHHRFFVQYHDITDHKRFEEQLKKEGVTQIEHNMEQFQILNDQIRNPLQAIRGFVDLNCVQYKERIFEQINILDSLVDRLDRGWVESEKVRRFLLRNYLRHDVPNPNREDSDGGDI
jgi:PAS domain S-box-containing protein